MKQKLKYFLTGTIIGLSFLAMSAIAASVFFPYQGGTGTSTVPGSGSLLAGNGSGIYGLLATSTNGKVLTSSSTASLGVSWESVAAAGVSSLNGLSGALNIVTSTAYQAAITITAGGSNITLVQPQDLIDIGNIATTTGVLIVASSTGWKGMAPGSNGSVLMGSSSAPFSIAWTPIVQSVAAGVGISVSGATGNITITNSAPNFNTTTTISAGSGITVSNGGIGATTVTNNGVLALTAGNNIVLSSATGTVTVNVSPSFSTGTITTATTTKLVFSGDSTFLTSGYKESGFSISSTTAVSSSSVLASKFVYGSYTMTNLDCYTNGANITFSIFERTSSTPLTNGTTTLANMTCTSSHNSTTTFDNANFGPTSNFVVASSSVANTTTTLVVGFRFKER